MAWSAQVLSDTFVLAGEGAGGLCISEFMASNRSTPLADAGEGVFVDWIELHNAGADAVNLNGWHLTDDPGIPFKWGFPDVALPAGGYLVVLATGNLSPPAAGAVLEANFQLSAGGDYLALTDPGLQTVFEWPAGGGMFPEQHADVSYGLAGGQPRHMKHPTPGAANDPEEFVRVRDTRFSVGRGMFTEPFTVEITSATEGAGIRYTVDNTTPTETNGALYSAPILIDTTTVLKARAFKEGFEPTNVDTQTYIFPAGVARQERPADYPARWGGEPNADYEVDPDVALSDDYRDRFLEGMRALPVVSLSMPVDDLFGTQGLYSRTTTAGLEKQASAEYFRPSTDEDGVNTEAGFRLQCGVSIQGGASRNPDSSIKHSMSLRFREAYGTDRVQYPLFDAAGAVTRFNSLHLRAMYNNSWIHRDAGQRNRATMIRDQWMRDTLIEMGNPDAGHGHYCHLFLNGLYWGVYNLHERLENAHYAAYFGIADDATVENVTPPERPPSYRELQDAVRNKDWPEIVKRLDVDNYIDYYITEHFGHNDDLKTDGNWRAAGGGTSGSLWRFYVWDSERVLENVRATGTLAASSQDGPEFIRYLADIPEFQVRFGDRLQKHFAPGAALTAEASLARWNRYAAMLDVAIVCESARWGDDRRALPYTRDAEWIAEVTKVREDFFRSEEPNRTSYFREKWEREEWPGGNDVPKYVAGPAFLVGGGPSYGGILQPGQTIAFDASGGSVYYTLDGTDPFVPVSDGEPEILLDERVPATAFVPVDASLGMAWTLPGFDDSGWLSGTTGIGFDYPELTGLDASSMHGVNGSIYVRVPFELADQAALDAIGSLALNMKYEDGFAAFLNGVEVAAANRPGTLEWNSTATGSHSDADAVVFEEYEVSAGVAALRVGANVLALQLMNSSTGSSDLLGMPQLTFRPGPDATPYTEPLVLSHSATIKARSFSAAGWSAVQVGEFIVEPVAGAGDIVISEIDYHPADPTEPEFNAGLALPNPQTFSEDDFEFVELANTSGHEVNLYGLAFTDGIRLTLGSFVLFPGERAVVVRNREAFVARYGAAVPIAGEYLGSLANGGEALALAAHGGEPLISLVYGDDDPWPAAADGDGSSLVLAAGADPALPGSWSAAAPTPGTDGDAVGGYGAWAALHFGAEADTLGSPGADPEGDGVVNVIEYALNMLPTVIDPAGLPSVGRAPDGSAVMTWSANPAAVDVLLQPESSRDLVNWEPVAASGNGDGTASATVPVSGESGVFLRLRVSER